MSAVYWLLEKSHFEEVCTNCLVGVFPIRNEVFSMQSRSLSSTLALLRCGQL